MKFNARKASLASPGVTGTARVGKPTSTLISRLRPGDIAVIDHIDLDSDTATALVDAGVVAVVNAAPMISGRYANLGPEVLAEAGVLVVDRVGAEGLDKIHDDQEIRVHDGVVYAVGPDGQTEELAAGRHLDLHVVHDEMDQSRAGLVVQLDTLAHTTRLPPPRAGAAAQRPRAARADRPARRACRRGRRPGRARRPPGDPPVRA